MVVPEDESMAGIGFQVVSVLPFQGIPMIGDGLDIARTAVKSVHRFSHAQLISLFCLSLCPLPNP